MLNATKKPKSVIQTTLVRSGLGRLVINMLTKFGPLTIDQLVELVECENSTYQYGPNFGLLNKLQQCLYELTSLVNYLDYEANSGKFSVSRTLNLESSKIGSAPQIIGTESFSSVTASNMKFEKIGYGSDYVYIVYSKAMRLEAILKGEEIWPLKVGKTNNLKRRIVQLSESGPNSLIIGLVIRSDNAIALEKIIHKKLTMRGQAIEMAHRQEWFKSNLSQIKNIYYQLQNREAI